MASKSPPPNPPTILRRLINLDTLISLHLYTIFNPILPFTLLKTLEISGDGRLFFPLILSFIFTTNPITNTITTTSIFLINLLIASLLDLILIGLFKTLIRRPRPVYNKNMFLSFAVDHWSFPSGHSSRVSFIASLFYLYSEQAREVLAAFLNGGDGKSSVFLEYLVVIVGVWAGVVSVSRVLLGRHFVMDVVAGVCLGVVEGLLVFRVFNYENLSLFFIR